MAQEKMMGYCPFCGQRQRHPGLADFTHSENDRVVMVRHVPAEICANCGEAYFDEETSQQLYNIVTKAIDGAGEVTICEFEAPQKAA